MRMNLKQLASKLISDESGAETMEYSLIIGLIVVGAIAIVSAVGTRVVGRWTTVKNGL